MDISEKSLEVILNFNCSIEVSGRTWSTFVVYTGWGQFLFTMTKSYVEINAYFTLQ